MVTVTVMMHTFKVSDKGKLQLKRFQTKDVSDKKESVSDK
jgi:hypothetical protein